MLQIGAYFFADRGPVVVSRVSDLGICMQQDKMLAHHSLYFGIRDGIDEFFDQDDLTLRVYFFRVSLSTSFSRCSASFATGSPVPPLLTRTPE